MGDISLPRTTFQLIKILKKKPLGIIIIFLITIIIFLLMFIILVLYSRGMMCGLK